MISQILLFKRTDTPYWNFIEVYDDAAKAIQAAYTIGMGNYKMVNTDRVLLCEDTFIHQKDK